MKENSELTARCMVSPFPELRKGFQGLDTSGIKEKERFEDGY